MADEEDALSIVDAYGGALYSPAWRSSRLSLRVAVSLKHKSAIVVRFRCLDAEAPDLRLAIQFFEHLFVLLWRNPLLGQTAAHRNKEEDRPEHDVLLIQKLRQGIDLTVVAASDRRVDLCREADLPGEAKKRERSVVTARYASKGIVRFGIGGIQTQCKPA